MKQHRYSLRKLQLYIVKRELENFAIICMWIILEKIMTKFVIEYCTNFRHARQTLAPNVPSAPSILRARACNYLGFKCPSITYHIFF